MTSGERMVWAAEFVRVESQASGANGARFAAIRAASAVTTLRDLVGHTAAELPAEARAMLDDMLGVPR